MEVVEYMLREREKEAGIDKAIDRTVEVIGQFSDRIITEFLTTYNREMQQRDVLSQDKFQASRVWWYPGIQAHIIEIQNAQTTWVEFETVHLAKSVDQMVEL